MNNARRVPEAFSIGNDRHNAQKAWLDGYDTAVRAGSDQPEPEATMHARLSEFCARERALIEARGKGGQSVGRSPSITPSVLKELESILRAGLPAPPEPKE